MLDLCVEPWLTFLRIRFLWAACFFVGHWFLVFVWRAVYSSVLLPVQTAPPGPRQRLFECRAFHYCLSAETVGNYYMQVNILFERVQSLGGAVITERVRGQESTWNRWLAHHMCGLLKSMLWGHLPEVKTVPFNYARHHYYKNQIPFLLIHVI